MRDAYDHYFPVPDFLAMSSHALDISDESIKYGKIVLKSNGFQVESIGQEKIPAGVVSSGAIANEAMLVEILKKIKEKEKMNFVRISLPEEKMYLFNIVLPKLTHDQIKETITLQLEDHIPLSASDAVFDYELIREVNNDSIFVQVVATSVQVIESYLSLLSQVGLSPLSFELETQAIARAVVKKDLEGSAMIVDFGRTRTGISIVENGRVMFTSTFDMGGQRITEVISKHFKVSFEQAEQMKKAYSDLGSDSENDIFPAIVSNLSVLLDELRKHYSYWHTHPSEDGQTHTKIQKVILCGGESNLYGIVSYLKTSMEMDVEHANVWVNMLDIAKDLPEMPFGESLTYPTIFGLALGGFIKE